MTPTTFAAAALVLSAAAGLSAPAAAAGHAEVPITAIYKTATQRFCVRPETLEEAASTAVAIYDRQCMTARQWKVRGVRFAPPEPSTVLARK